MYSSNNYGVQMEDLSVYMVLENRNGVYTYACSGYNVEYELLKSGLR